MTQLSTPINPSEQALCYEGNNIFWPSTKCTAPAITFLILALGKL